MTCHIVAFVYHHHKKCQNVPSVLSSCAAKSEMLEQINSNAWWSTRHDPASPLQQTEGPDHLNKRILRAHRGGLHYIASNQHCSTLLKMLDKTKHRRKPTAECSRADYYVMNDPRLAIQNLIVMKKATNLKCTSTASTEDTIVTFFAAEKSWAVIAPGTSTVSISVKLLNLKKRRRWNLKHWCKYCWQKEPFPLWLCTRFKSALEYMNMSTIYFTTFLVDTDDGPSFTNEAYRRPNWTYRSERFDVPKPCSVTKESIKVNELFGWCWK